LPAFQDARGAAAAQLLAGRARPGVGGEGGAVEGAERFRDLRLQTGEVGTDGLKIVGRISHVLHQSGDGWVPVKNALPDAKVRQ